MTDFQNQLAQQVQVLGGHAHSVDTGNALKVQKNQSTQALMMLNNLLEVYISDVYQYHWPHLVNHGFIKKLNFQLFLGQPYISLIYCNEMK